jgi:dTDP-4-amino-4,6-dideoxygalactose transaminase
VQYKGESILNYGDISTLSFHATKLFHSIEGGALIIKDDDLVNKARYLINFGIKNEESIPELGTNAKMNEFEAAMGLCMLDEIEIVTLARKKVFELYVKELVGQVKLQEMNDYVTLNHSYFPIVLKNELQLLKVQKALNEHDIYPRRYFFPSLDTLCYINPKQFMPNSRKISLKILCLPMYPSLDLSDVKYICNIIKNNLC